MLPPRPRVLTLLAASWLLAVSALPAAAAQLQVKFGSVVIGEDQTYDFGSTLVGEDLSFILTIKNVGSSAVSLGGYSVGYNVNDPSHFSVGDINVPSPLPAGSSGTVELIYHADAPGTVTNSFRLFAGGVPDWEFFPKATTAVPNLRARRGSTEIPAGTTHMAATIAFNSPLTLTFTAVNDGDAPLAISNVDFTGDRLQLLQAPPASIPANGGTGTFKLKLKADIEGPHSPLVKIWSNDPDENPYEFFLSWIVDDAIGPVLRVELGGDTITQGELVDFGFTGVAMPLTRTFTAFNDGDQPLTIGTISIGSHVNDPSSFGVGFNQAINIPPGGNKDFRLDFDAAGLGTVTSEIDLFVGGISRREFFVKGTVLPPDFQISVTPSSRTVVPGMNAFYTVSVTGLYGFMGAVPLSISDLPTATNHTFTPVNVPAGSSAQLKVGTSASTPLVSGATFAVSGTDGSTLRSDTAQITVAPPGDFTLAVAPSLRTLTPGDSTSYTVTLDPVDGFNQSVTLSVSGLPADTTASFNPPSLTPPGTSTLTVNTGASTPLGDKTLTPTGSGGGKTHGRNVTLRLVAAGSLPPIVDAITPDRLNAGQILALTLTGQNLQGAVVDIATTPVNPGDPTPAVYPDVSLVSINSSGTSMVVSIDATAPGVGGFYNLSISTATGATGAPFRVLGNGPEVDIWTPKEPARGHIYSLSMLGENLDGATVSVSGGSGVFAFVVLSGPGQLTGYLDVSESASLGPRTLVVKRGGRQTQVPITIVADTQASALQTLNVTEEAAKEAAKSGQKVPEILLQEFTARDDLAWATEEGEASKLICSVTLGWQLYRYRYTLALPFDPLTGEVLLTLLRNLNLGIPIPTGVAIFSAFADLVLQLKFNFCPVSHLQICLHGNIGYEIPGVKGQIFTAGGCIFGGAFFPTVTTTGTVSDFTFRNDGSCTDVTQITPPDIGEQRSDVTLNSCCTEDLRIDTFGSSFNGTIYGVSWSATNHAVTPISPNPAVCPCPCLARLSSLALKAGETKNLDTRIENMGTATCSYNWSLSTAGSQGATPTFVPASGTVAVPAGATVDIAAQIGLPSTFADGRPANLLFDVTPTSSSGGCTGQATLCAVPSEETTQFIQWTNRPDHDVAQFKGTLTPIANWQGTQVMESPTGTGTVDNCWIPGVPPHLRLTDQNVISGGIWDVGMDAIYGVGTNPDMSYDNIGSLYDLNVFYSALGRTPCTRKTTQTMNFVCPSILGKIEYNSNLFLYNIGNNGTIICRDGACASPIH